MPEASSRAVRSGDSTPNQKVIAEIVRALSGLRYGAVEISVHNGTVTQIERREKTRIHEDLRA